MKAQNHWVSSSLQTFRYEYIDSNGMLANGLVVLAYNLEVLEFVRHLHSCCSDLGENPLTVGQLHNVLTRTHTENTDPIFNFFCATPYRSEISPGTTGEGVLLLR